MWDVCPVVSCHLAGFVDRWLVQCLCCLFCFLLRMKGQIQTHINACELALCRKCFNFHP